MRQTFSSLSLIICIFSCLSTTTALAQKRDLTWRVNPAVTLAQITPDDTLGTQVNSQGNVDEITGGQTRGGNLFHSFQDFSVENGSEAFFNNADKISNIFSRVTGGNISTIEGLISANGNANLFLINPSGIIFGENASLDVNGSFVATSASAIKFGEQGFFSTTDPEPPSLLTVNPDAFFFNQMNSGAIESQSTAPAGFDSLNNSLLGLRVRDGKSLVFLGGEVALNGGGQRSGLHAIDGQVELAGVDQQGTVGLNVDGVNLALNFPQEIELADISLNNGAFVNTSGEAGGAISIQGKNITLSDQSFIFADTLGSQDGSGILIKSLNLILDNASRVTTDVLGSGKGGDLNIETEQLNIQNNSAISSNVFGQGNSGNINIDATETLSIDRSVVASDVVNNAVGNSGDVNLVAKSLSISNGSLISSNIFGQGNSGNINIDATETLSIDRSAVASDVVNNAVGNSGDVNLVAKSLSITNESWISTSTFGQGNSGNINIDATETLSVLEGSSLNSNVSGVNGAEAGGITITANDVVFDGGFARSRVDTGAEGNGGDIQITTSSLLVTGIPAELVDSNIGQLVTASFGQGDAGNLTIDASGDVTFDGLRSDIFSLIGGNINQPNISQAEGNAGNIIINSNSLSVKNQARLVSSVEGIGNAGNIKINTRSLSIMDGGNLLAEVDPIGIGNAGNIEIITETFNLINGGRLNARTAGAGNAGNIKIQASDSIFLSGIEGNNLDNESQTTITTSVGSQAMGQGGNVVITTPKLEISNRAEITSITQGQGNSGNIELLELKTLLLDNNSSISAEAVENSNGGNVTINADNGFIFASPDENSDITANAEQGQGGNITINTQAIFGLEERSSTPENQTNDIDASSDFGLSGTVQINILQVDPSQDSLNVPVQQVQAEVTRTCQTNNSSGDRSEFVVTRRGGLPPEPEDNFRLRAIARNEVAEPTTTPENGLKSETFAQQQPGVSQPIVEATKWIRNAEGKIVLFASSATESSLDSHSNSANCNL